MNQYYARDVEGLNSSELLAGQKVVRYHQRVNGNYHAEQYKKSVS
jgi:hypothetical protein